MIYDSLLHELEKMCEVMKINMKRFVPIKSVLQQQIEDGMNIKEMAAYYGKSIKTITVWRKNFGITETVDRHKPKTINYDRMDRMIRGQKSQEVIAKSCRCSLQSVSNRMSEINGERLLIRGSKYDDVNAPVIPPDDRPSRLLEMKLAEFSPAHRAAFMGGLAYRQTLEGLTA